MRTIAIASMLCLAFASRASAANNELQNEENRPWAAGVSESERAEALQLFQKGNGDLKNSYFLEAANAYREALKHWDHPAIHYNLVLALLNLDQPVEVHNHLEMAMKYGSAPLDEDKFAQAERYKKLVEKQLTLLKIDCPDEGAKVTLDGAALFTGPGHQDVWVRSGPHTLLASKEGYVPYELSKPLPPGETETVNAKLYTDDELTQYRRRWKASMPWMVVASGAAVAGIGAAMTYQASQDFKNYDSGVKTCAGANPAVGGCPTSSASSAQLKSQLSQGNTFQSVAVGAYAVGGAALVTGAVLVYLNRLQPYHINPGDEHVEVGIAPYVAPGQAGVWAQAHF